MNRSAATGLGNDPQATRWPIEGPASVAVAAGWVPADDAPPNHLRERLATAEPGALDAALAAAVRDGRAAFAARCASTGHPLAVALRFEDERVLVAAEPVSPPPLAAQAMVRMAGAGLAPVDAEGIHRFVNDAYCRIHGTPADALLGGHCAGPCRTPDRATMVEHHEATLRGESRGRPLEVMFTRADGGAVNIDTRSCRIDLPDGTRMRLVTVLDITAIRSSLDRLAEAEARLRDITSSMPGAVDQLVRDAAGGYRVTHMSEGLRELAGLGPDARIDDFETLVGLLPPDHASSAIASAEASARALGPFEQEFSLGKPAGRRWVQARSQPHRLEGGSVVWSGLMIDVTEQRRTEERLAVTQHRLQAIAGSLPGAIYQFLHRADGHDALTYMSEGLHTICGLSEEPPLADLGAFLELVPKGERGDLIATMRRSARTLQPLQHEFRLASGARTFGWRPVRSRSRRPTATSSATACSWT